MKTLLSIILTVISIHAFSQISWKPVIMIWEVEKDTVTAGDSLYIGFKYNYNGGIPVDTAPCHIQWYGKITDTIVFIWKGQYKYLSTLPVYGPDNLTKMYLHVPAYESGVVRIYSMNHHGGGLAYKLIYIKRPVGINEYSGAERVRRVLYYNELGQEIQKPQETHGLVIEVTITDTRTTVKKLININ